MVKLTYLARLAVHEILRVTGGGAGSGLGSALSALVNTRHYIEATAEKGSVARALALLIPGSPLRTMKR